MKINENIDKISENIILKNQSLYDFYMNYYNNYYHLNWDNNKIKNTLIPIFESVCKLNNKKFRFLSIIQNDVYAFKTLIENSEILKNDEEIQEYIKVFDKIKNDNDENTWMCHDLRKSIEDMIKEVDNLSYNMKKLEKEIR